MGIGGKNFKTARSFANGKKTIIALYSFIASTSKIQIGTNYYRH
jgi:hypothetical protein